MLGSGTCPLIVITRNMRPMLQNFYWVKSRTMRFPLLLKQQEWAILNTVNNLTLHVESEYFII